MLKIFYIMRTF